MPPLTISYNLTMLCSQTFFSYFFRMIVKLWYLDLQEELIIVKTALEKPFLPIFFIGLLAAHIALLWLLPYIPLACGKYKAHVS